MKYYLFKLEEYFSTDTIRVINLEEKKIIELYSNGYLFTRQSKGTLNQTRSLRINLSLFKVSSENRRILNKNPNLEFIVKSLPLETYSWEIHKLGKDFYSKKFGDHIMSASKIKEMFTEEKKSNMNATFIYTLKESVNKIGYSLIYINNNIIHYAYPFYDLNIPQVNNLGLAMMTKAIIWSKLSNKQYIYLGSVTDPKSKYKLQFEGLEWWNNEIKIWDTNIKKLKNLIK